MLTKVMNANVAVWTLQALLALFFIAGSGAPKLLLPEEMIPMPIPIAHPFLVAIGTCEILGGLGLVLSVSRRLPRWLTPLAALCLTALTVCAAVYQVLGHQPESAIFALVIGALCAIVAYARDAHGLVLHHVFGEPRALDLRLGSGSTDPR